ncbi:MAG: hypothetical protein ACTSXT_13680 [Candidatus Helarchaeota archaeon]
MNKIFICEICKKQFPFIKEKDDEAIKELNKNFPGISKEECGIVCEDCYRKIMKYPSIKKYMYGS